MSSKKQPEPVPEPLRATGGTFSAAAVDMELVYRSLRELGYLPPTHKTDVTLARSLASKPAPAAPSLTAWTDSQEKIAQQAHALSVLWSFIEQQGLLAAAVAFCDEQGASVST